MATLVGLFKSKTFWFNFGTGVIALITDAMTTAGMDPVYFTSFVALANVGLRAVTTEPLADK